MTQETFEQATNLVNDIKCKKIMIGNLSEMIDRAENEKIYEYILRVEYKPGQYLNGCTVDYSFIPELLPAMKQAMERMKNEVQELERQLDEL
jgi:hypothetical protein